jgi:adenosine deaminase
LNCAAQGTVYVELMISPAHSVANGISFADQISAISDALEEAKEISGIDSAIIVTAVRPRDPGEANEVAALAADAGNQSLVGFGLAGNERLHNIKIFAALSVSLARPA